MKHTVVFYEKGKFGGWPANGGIWRWDNEILVSFNIGTFNTVTSIQHRIDQKKPYYMGFARSTDGGESWTSWQLDPSVYSGEIKPVPKGGFDFEEPGFCLRVGIPAVKILASTFIVSYDKGETWDGPYALPEAEGQLTFRTCYHIEGNKKMKMFGSRMVDEVVCLAYSDRAYSIETTDGGQTWTQLGDMTKDNIRSVMPDVVRLSDGTLVAAVRRRWDTLLCSMEEALGYKKINKKPPHRQDCWIEIERSTDDGRTWTKAARAADTDLDMNLNGNPPAMAQLHDGRLVLIYGYRGKQNGGPAMKAKTSSDGGYTWSDEYIIRYDMLNSDIGYPRVTVRPDGKVVTCYYYATKERPEQHIECSIFEI